MKKISKIISLSALALITMTGLVGCGNTQQEADKQSQPNTTTTSYASNGASNSKLANLQYHSGQSAVVKINNNKATLKPNWKNDHVIYSKLDKQLRTSNPNTGWLDNNNVANDSLRTRQTFKPTGYHQKFVNGKPILNRGHEIAYSLSKGIDQKGQYNPKKTSGDQNNPKNLFTQTAFSNQELQTIYESKVRHALEHHQKVVYQVQPIFKGHNQMANGVHMQAISTNHQLDYNVFLYNVQPGIKFNYLTGRSTINHGMKVPTPKGAPHFNDNGSDAKTNYAYRKYPRKIYRHHHWVRDYAMYRVGKHFVRKHYAKKYGYRYGRRARYTFKHYRHHI